MISVISDELLKEILGDIVTKNVQISPSKLLFKESRAMIDTSHIINIHELAHKCKDWAWNKDFVLESFPITFDGETMDARVNVTKGKANSLFLSSDYFDESTEPEAIFKACEWILSQEGRGEVEV